MGQIKTREIRLLNSDSGSNEEKINYCQECEWVKGVYVCCGCGKINK
jgi:hypothetical protein